MPRRIVLFGASGFTGRLVAEALARDDVRFVLAGRSYQRLATLALRLGKGLDIVLADVRRLDSLLGMVRPGDVLVSTVGPYQRYGAPVVQLAISRRAAYIDACAEPSFLRYVFEDLDPLAQRMRVTLLPGFGYQYVAGSLAAALALAGAGSEATTIDIAYFLQGSARGAISAGTRASAAAALRRHYAWRLGALLTVPPADRTEIFSVDGRNRSSLAVGGAEHFTVPRVSPGIREVGVYTGGGSALATRIKAALLSRAAGVARLADAAAWISRVPIGSGGPDPDRRRNTGIAVIARARDGQGRELRTVRLQGCDPYGFTGALMARAAQRLAQQEEHEAGALGPVEVFGLDALRSVCADAGISVAGDDAPSRRALEDAEAPAARDPEAQVEQNE